jgi:PKD repeat protein
LALVVCAIALSALPATAGAVGYGELPGRFGSKGTTNGQFIEPGSGAIAAFGVEPTTQSIYVGDEPQAHVFRIQKFDSTGKFLASTEFKVSGGAGAESVSSIQGFAFDPKEQIGYVLAVQTRGPEEKVGEAPETPAAAEIRSFSTVTSGETFTTKIVAGQAVLQPQSSTEGQALLSPSGIAVDPVSHDIVVVGMQGFGEEEPRVAVQRVSPTGTPVVPRWVDSATPFFESASSPVVTSTGQVLVLGSVPGAALSEQIDEIPASFSGAPKPLVQFDPGANELITFPALPAPTQGAGMSLAPNGTIWVSAKLKPTVESFNQAAVMAFTPTGEEIGFSGGGNIQAGIACTIGFNNPPAVAATNAGVLAFDSSPAAPSVIPFGPSGTGCPAATAAPLEATLAGAPAPTPIAPGSEVKLSSAVARGNATSVKWSFGDGTAEVETKNQHQMAEVLHKFTTEGEFKVKATIKTDNLDTPELSVERTLQVSKPLPSAGFNFKPSVLVGEADEFDAKTSTDPYSSPITEYQWEFGDGASTTTTTATVSHAYAAAGTYTVTLHVVDAMKLRSPSKTHTVAVTAPVSGGGGGGGGGGGTSSTPATTTPPPPPVPSQEVLPYTLSVPSTTLLASKSGALGVKIDCAGRSSCIGTVTLRTAAAIAASGHKKAILTLAVASFQVSGGQVKTIGLRLSAKARVLLARAHSVKVRLTISAKDAAGQVHTTSVLMTLRATKKK